jgi:hypothetical protein
MVYYIVKKSDSKSGGTLDCCPKKLLCKTMQRQKITMYDKKPGPPPVFEQLFFRGTKVDEIPAAHPDRRRYLSNFFSAKRKWMKYRRHRRRN